MVRETALEKLSNAGYQIVGDRQPLNASDFGVPQNRRRLLIMGSLTAAISEPKHLPGRPPTVADALDGLPNPARYRQLRTSDTVSLSDVAFEKLRSTKSSYARILAGLAPDASDRSHLRFWSEGLLTNSRVTRHTEDAVARFRATLPGQEEKISRYYRLTLDGQARTLRAGTGRERGAFTSPRPIHPTQPRTITVREAARLHSFPDWFRFHVTNWHGHRQVGNSVPPLLAKASAISIRDALAVQSGYTRLALGPGDESLLSLSLTGASKILEGKLDEMPAPRTRENRRPLRRQDIAS
jgi:DNA (cytosine-5)-methyltransferase 1